MYLSEIRPIDGNALIESIEVKGKEYGVTVANRCTFRDIAKLAPTLDYEPVRHSQWQLRSFAPRKITVDGIVVCPECGYEFFRIVGTWFKRCPKCGSKMDEKVV